MLSSSHTVKLARDCNTRGDRVILAGTEQRPATEKLLTVKINAVPEPGEATLSSRKHSRWDGRMVNRRESIPNS